MEKNIADEKKKSIVILLAEDNEDDYLLTKRAFKEALLLNPLYHVEDGEELMDYLLNRGKYQNPKDAPRPGIILLDLTMPRKDGRDALREIKKHPDLHKIPVVILTVSKAEEDIILSYDIGASSFIRKPITFEQLVDAVKTIKKYWLEIVELPHEV